MRREGRLPDWVIWDWNGTLLDDVRAGADAVNSLLTERGLPPLTLDRYRETFVFPVSGFYRSAGIEPDQEDWAAMAEEYHRRFLASPHLRLRPEAPGVIGDWLARGVRQCVLSALEQSRLTEALAAAGLSRCFEHAIGSDNLYGTGKTALAGMLSTLAGMRPEDDVLMIGDTLHDAEVAAEMGWRCILVAQGHQARARLAQAGVPVVANFTDLAKEMGANYV